METVLAECKDRLLVRLKAWYDSFKIPTVQQKEAVLAPVREVFRIKREALAPEDHPPETRYRAVLVNARPDFCAHTLNHRSMALNWNES